LLVEVRNNQVDRAIRLLKRKMTAEGIFQELRERRFFEKKSDKRRRLKKSAVMRQRKSDREREV